MRERNAIDALILLCILCILIVMGMQLAMQSDRIDKLERRLHTAERNVTSLAWECLGDPLEDDAPPMEAE